MSRLDRKKQRSVNDLGLKESGGMLDLIDNEVMLTYFINSAEYDHVAEHATEEEIELLVLTPESTLKDIRNALSVIDKYIY